jgi:PTS system cellobiose-specific IIB component
MKIILACAVGMSTSMLVERMKKAAVVLGMSIDIAAHPVSELGSHSEGCSAILLGPQVSYMKDKVAAAYPAIYVNVINMQDYGMMNGEKVLKDVLQAIK